MSDPTVSYRVTMQDADGNALVVEGAIDQDVPHKGDTFEYEHREVRVGTVVKVEKVTTAQDGTTVVETLTEIGNAHHSLAPEDVMLDPDAEVVPDSPSAIDMEAAGLTPPSEPSTEPSAIDAATADAQPSTDASSSSSDTPVPAPENG